MTHRPASSTSTQSESSAAFLPGEAKLRGPELASEEPATFLNVPSVESYHRALTGPEKRDMSTVIVVSLGQYARPNVPAGFTAAPT